MTGFIPLAVPRTSASEIRGRCRGGRRWPVRSRMILRISGKRTLADRPPSPVLARRAPAIQCGPGLAAGYAGQARARRAGKTGGMPPPARTPLPVPVPATATTAEFLTKVRIHRHRPGLPQPSLDPGSGPGFRPSRRPLDTRGHTHDRVHSPRRAPDERKRDPGPFQAQTPMADTVPDDPSDLRETDLCRPPAFSRPCRARPGNPMGPNLAAGYAGQARAKRAGKTGGMLPSARPPETTTALAAAPSPVPAPETETTAESLTKVRTHRHRPGLPRPSMDPGSGPGFRPSRRPLDTRGHNHDRVHPLAVPRTSVSEIRGRCRGGPRCPILSRMILRISGKRTSADRPPSPVLAGRDPAIQCGLVSPLDTRVMPAQDALERAAACSHPHARLCLRPQPHPPLSPHPQPKPQSNS